MKKDRVVRLLVFDSTLKHLLVRKEQELLRRLLNRFTLTTPIRHQHLYFMHQGETRIITHDSTVSMYVKTTHTTSEREDHG